MCKATVIPRKYYFFDVDQEILHLRNPNTMVESTLVKVCKGSVAAKPRLRPSTSALAPKGDIPANEITALVSAANGHKRLVAAHDLNGSFGLSKSNVCGISGGTECGQLDNRS
jgi:hypothetical protein